MLDYPSKSTHPDTEVQKRLSSAYELFEKGEIEEAKKLLLTNLEEGCIESSVLLGAILADGSETDRKRSIELFRIASDEDSPTGSRNLAYCYAIGLNIEKDKKKAAELYIKSALLGNVKSACNIGVMLDYGNGVKKDYKEAFEWYTKSAEGGYTRGMTNLGEYYLWGRGTPKDVDKAIYWLERSGSPRAIFRLSEIYLDEEGYIDKAKGLEYLKQSAEKGHSRSMIRYANIIEESDPQTARGLLEKAAAKGNREAIAELEKRGLPVPENTRKKRSS
jgi:hypothetical protein